MEEVVLEDPAYLTLKIIKLMKNFSPTALLFSRDNDACIALKILKDIGYDVPSRMSVMGYNDEPMAHLVSPSLSTIKVPLSELGEEAGKVLIARIKGEKRDIKVLEPKLLARNSTAAIDKRSNINNDLKNLKNFEIAGFATDG